MVTFVIQIENSNLLYNKDENVHIFALSAIRGELLKREKEKKKERERKERGKREKRERERRNKDKSCL